MPKREARENSKQIKLSKNRLGRASLYRERAKELLAIAEQQLNEEAIQMLTEFAREYDKMADRSERADQRKRSRAEASEDA
jgi:hypothetical protein